MSNELERHGAGNLSPAQLYAGMDPLERLRTEADNNVAAVVHQRFDTERKLRETAERHRAAEDDWARTVKAVKRRRRGGEPSPEEYGELEQLGAARRSLEWQLTQYRTRLDELVQIERELRTHRVDLETAADEMRVEVDTLRYQQVLVHAQTSMVHIQHTMRRLSSEIAYARRDGAYAGDRARAELDSGRPLTRRLGQVARDIADELYAD